MQETGSTPTIPSAPALAAPAPTGSFVKDALYLAVRESQRGEPAKARAQIKTAIQQLDLVGDQSERAYWQGQIDETTAYVEANAGAAEAAKKAALLADGEYVNGQKLRPDEIVDLNNDNADTQRALDAKARGEEASLVYNRIPNPGNATAKLVATINPEGAKDAGIQTKGASISDLPSTVRYLIYAGIAATFLFALGYGFVYYRATRAVAGGVS